MSNQHDDLTPEIPFPPFPMPPRDRPRRAGRSAAVCSVLAVIALGIGACGGDESSSTTSAADDSAPPELTASEFIAEVAADKQAYIEEVVATEPKCDGLDADEGFLLDVSARATDLPPDAPINPEILDACTP